MSARFASLLSAAAALALLPACMVGPDYRQPSTSVPSAYVDAAPGAAATADIARFWTVFGDAALDELVNQALTANHDLRIALASLNTARALRRESRYDLLPAVTGSAGYTRQQLARDQVGPEVPRDSELTDAGFDAFWELDLFGRVRRNVEATTADLAAAEANLQDVQVSVTAEVARNYFELRGAQDRLIVAQENARIQEESLTLTQRRLDAGRGTELDTSQAQAQLSATLASIPAFETQIAASARRLAVLTGRDPESARVVLAPAVAWPVLPELVPVGKPEDLLRRRPDIRRAERELAAATARIGVAVGDLFPKLSFTGSIGLAATDVGDLGGSGSDTYRIGPALTWAAFDLGRVRARIQAAEAQGEGALARYELTVLQALEDSQNGVTAYGRARVREGHLREAATASAQAARLSRVRFDGGASDFLQVLDAERVKLQAGDIASQARTDTALRLVALYKALGGGWQAPLAVPIATTPPQ